MKELLEDMLLVLNSLPNRKLRGSNWTTYDLAKRVEAQLDAYKIQSDYLKLYPSEKELKELINEQS